MQRDTSAAPYAAAPEMHQEEPAIYRFFTFSAFRRLPLSFIRIFCDDHSSALHRVFHPSAWPSVDRASFSVDPHELRPFRTRFGYHSPVPGLPRWRRLTRRLILEARRRPSPEVGAPQPKRGFRISLHSPGRVLFTVPSRYSSASVDHDLALTVVHPCSPPGFRTSQRILTMFVVHGQCHQRHGTSPSPMAHSMASRSLHHSVPRIDYPSRRSSNPPYDSAHRSARTPYQFRLPPRSLAATRRIFSSSSRICRCSRFPAVSLRFPG